MKNKLLLFFLLTGFVSLYANQISQDDAAKVAGLFIKTKSAPALRRVSVSENSTDKPAYYVYTGEDGKGFVIVSADDVAHPILGYSKTNSFRCDSVTTNISYMLRKYEDMIKVARELELKPTEQVQEEWNELYRAANTGILTDEEKPAVGPLLTTTWDQTEPYWNLCPKYTSTNILYRGYVFRAYTGCVATAMAQVMNYWKWPKQGEGSHSYRPKNPNTYRTSTKYSVQSANFGETTYDWKNMLDNYYDLENDSVLGTEEQQLAVATLMYHCGVSVDMMYGDENDGGSGAYSISYDGLVGASVEQALVEYFKYKGTLSGIQKEEESGSWWGWGQTVVNYTDSEWAAILKAELDAKRPVIYSGADNSAGGHCFVCDGYLGDMFHINWGWSGVSDGYFRLTALNPGTGGVGGGTYNFSDNADMLIGIEPDYPEGYEETTALNIIGTNDNYRLIDISGMKGEIKVEIFNLCGQTMKIINLNNNTDSVIDISDLPYGQYVVKASDNIKTYSAKMMKL